MFVGLNADEEEKAYTFSDTKRVWKAIDYGHSWGLEVNKGCIFFFNSFSEMLMFLANEEKLWYRG